MGTFIKTIVIIVSVLLFLVLIGWTGLQIKPSGFQIESVNESTDDLEINTEGMPGSVACYIDSVFQDKAIKIKTLEVCGSADFRINGISMKGRYRTFYEVGVGFLRYIEITWFGMPVLKGYDLYTEEEAVFCMAGKAEKGERIAQGQNIVMWAEAVWYPSVFLEDNGSEWKQADEGNVNLVIPYDEESDKLSYCFDETTGLVREIEAMRYKGNEEQKKKWTVECLEWDVFNDMKVPVLSSIKWEDEKKPWALWGIDDISFNVPVSEGFTEEMEQLGIDPED